MSRTSVFLARRPPRRGWQAQREVLEVDEDGERVCLVGHRFPSLRYVPGWDLSSYGCNPTPPRPLARAPEGYLDTSGAGWHLCYRREDKAMTDFQDSTQGGSSELVMYCRTWCGDCARARVWLEMHDIPYTEIDVDADGQARQHAASLNDGHLHTPTFIIGEDVCVDFRPDRLVDLLGLD